MASRSLLPSGHGKSERFLPDVQQITESFLADDESEALLGAYIAVGPWSEICFN
jgi:hypothetical protein